MSEKKENEDVKESELEEQKTKENQDSQTEEKKSDDKINYNLCKKILIVIIILFCLCISISIIKIDRYKYKVYPKSSFYGVDISKMNELELNNLLVKIEKSILTSDVLIKTNEEDYNIKTKNIIKNTNKEKLSKEIMNYGKDKSYIGKMKEVMFPKEKNYSFNISFNEKALNKNINNIAKENDIKYENAKVIIEDEKINIKKESSGTYIDKENLKKSITKKISNIDKDNKKVVINAKYKEINAKIKSSELQDIDTKISQYHTSYSGSAGRRLNVENAAKKIDDLLLMPGDEFSYEKAVGPVTYENGYKDAPVIANGVASNGVGGGVCQVSSTMYNAQLKAGILPTERRNHSKAVSYVPRGLDATLASGSIDYKFKNTYDYPLVINTYTTGGNLYIEIWSNKEATNGISYKPVSYISGKYAESYLYGYDKGGKKIYEKYIDSSMYK